MTQNINLTINGEPIRINQFVEGFIGHIITGIVESLENTGKIKDLNLTIEGDKVTVNLNGSVIPTGAFTINFPRPYGRGINLSQTSFALNLFYLVSRYMFVSLLLQLQP